ncbi:TolC family protein [Adhaeribacter arboris]|uniref:TolC family protein n=1 Tax=Adhaeribacter arboris TaxID=2072846 RepID=A0A2T2YAR0_9BACT|nr:TolC family protein [Adhaeribacter arboris]PSR52605.1 TolC family protein [Adhaeribacter arboris]
MMINLSKKIVVAGAFIIGFIFSQPAMAQTKPKTWTLQECIDQAIKSNLTIQQTQLQADLSRVTLRQAQLNRLPTINGSTAYNLNSGRSIDPTTNSFVSETIKSNNLQVYASVPLFSGGQLINTIKRNNFDNQAAVADVARSRNDIMLNVVTFYIQIIFNNEILKANELLRSSTLAQLDRTQKLFNAGSVPETNVLELKAQLASDDVNIITAKNNIDIAKLNLSQLLNLPNAIFELEVPAIPDPDQDVIIVDANQIFETAQLNLPEVKAADLRVSSALAGIDISRSAYYPQLSFNAGYNTLYSSGRPLFEPTGSLVEQTLGFASNDGLPGEELKIFVPGSRTMKYPYFDQIKDNQSKNIGLSLNVPIFNGFLARNNVSRSKINHQNAVLNTELVRDQLQKSIQQSVADALAAQKKFIAVKNQLAALEQSYKNAEIRFANGVMNATDFNVARNNFTKAQSDLIQAKYDYTFKLKVLDYYQNKPLSF